MRFKREELQDVAVGSMDVVTLYPSLDQKTIPRIVSKEVENSLVRCEEANLHIAGVFLVTEKYIKV